MRDSNLFGKCNVIQLKPKIKLLVFYNSEKDKEVLYELRNECNTSICQYTLIPVHIELVGSTISEAIIKKYVKARAPGYKKDFDRVCIIESSIIQSNQYIIFDSVDKFKTWFQRMRYN